MAQLAANPRYLLHIGTEKTGSSFLQTQCARNREVLHQQGIWFPKGTRYDERCMLQGEISAGNGRVLAERVASGNWAGAEHWTHASVKQASRRSCGTILVSSEWLLPALAQGRGLGQLLEIFSREGVASVEILLVLRHPIDQFISLYKHRAKRGTAGTIDKWAGDGYTLPDHLRRLREQAEDRDVNLRVRRYTSVPGALGRLFFEEWLGIESLADTVSHVVNPSLSLSELVLLRHLAQRRPELVDDLYIRLLRVPRGEKTQGAALEEFSKNVAAQAVVTHADEWTYWNSLLPEQEKLEWPGRSAHAPEPPLELEFSEAQLEAVMQLVAESSRPNFQARLLWRHTLRPILGRLKRMLVHPLSRRAGNA